MGDSLPLSDPNPNHRGKKPKVVVLMGATGSGKSRLAIDIASFFPVETLNADSMQVYEGLDVLTNKVPVEDRKSVPHHLLGSVSATVDFTSKDFRDQAIPIIDDILSRNSLPVIVGGTNYYIQALVSPFLLDDFRGDNDECNPNSPVGDTHPNLDVDWHDNDLSCGFDRLKELDPAAVNRIHPNDYRKVTHYLNLYANSGVLPSKLFQGKASEKWGRADNFRYDCCFIWLDASFPALDSYVDQRVDSMVDAGLLNEVCNIYNLNADYTRGLRQAIGVREFEEFFRCYLSIPETCSCDDENDNESSGETGIPKMDKRDKLLTSDLRAILDSDNNKLKFLLSEAIDRLKANTRRLIRRQKRRLNRLRTIFGWDLHYIDATEAFLCDSGDSWTTKVVEPCVSIINSFLYVHESSVRDSKILNSADTQRSSLRDLWTQYVCEACGNRILRGAHEWEQHKQGRGHRKRVLSLRKKSQITRLVDHQQHPINAQYKK